MVYITHMIEDRIVSTHQKFDELAAKRNALIKEANELLSEMNRLEGEFRVLNDLKDTPQEDPNTITAIPDEEAK